MEAETKLEKCRENMDEEEKSLHFRKAITSKKEALFRLSLFKDLNPYAGDIDHKNRWIRLSKLVPWERLDGIYREHFDYRKKRLVKNSRLIVGLFLGQMLLEMSDRMIVEYFHENPYFQYFCGEEQFRVKGKTSIIHPSLLSKRRSRLGKASMQAFERAIIDQLVEIGLIRGNKLILDATVFPANITYPNDVKLLNTVRDYLCKTILKVKNTTNPSGRIRTYRRTAKKLYRNFQKTRNKSRRLIQQTRNKMLRYVRRNLGQLETVLGQSRELSQAVQAQIENRLAIAQTIVEQQTQLSKTKGARVLDRIVSFHRPAIRPIVRGKEGARVEFGPKAHIALVDGFACLDHSSTSAFNEACLLQESLGKHQDRFGKRPQQVLMDQLYSTRENRRILNHAHIAHNFKSIGRPPHLPKPEQSKNRRITKQLHGQRNAIEGAFGHLKTRFNLDKITWSVPDAESMQIHMGLIAFNLNKALAKV